MRTLAMVGLLVFCAAAMAKSSAAQPAGRPGEFTAANPPEAVAPTAMVDVSAKDDKRYWKVVKRLAEAFNDEDKQAFVQLFSQRLIDQRAKAHDPIEDAMGFMSAAMAKRGSIAKFHQLSSKGLKTAGSERVTRTVVFFLEDGMTGYFGIALDDKDKVDDFSYFLMPELCKSSNMCEGEVIPLAELPAG
ncbi:MAG: hypothetical protein HC897_18325 [Thermoanaerobaculia bacterium]|nr:hypothetical protein [Thermoanaerobaculia bacterium]